jgi:hypothetical protein
MLIIIYFNSRSCKEAYLILEKLHKFTSSPVFKEQLKTKYQAILRQYENELTTIETWFLVSFLNYLFTVHYILLWNRF